MTRAKKAIVNRWRDAVNQHYDNLRRPGLRPGECLLSTEVDRTSLKNRTKSALYNAGVQTVEGLLNSSSHALLRMKNCGSRTREDIWVFCSEFLDVQERLKLLDTQFAAGLYVPRVDVLTGSDCAHPDCLCVIVLRDVDPEDMNNTLRGVLPVGPFYRACVQIIDQEFADRFRGLPFEAAWDFSWEVALATVRYDR